MDVDQARRFSPRLLGWAIFGVLALLAAGYGSDRTAFGFVVGWFWVPELAIYARHLNNILFYRRLASDAPGVKGQVIASNEFGHWLSAVDVWCLAGFTLIL